MATINRIESIVHEKNIVLYIKGAIECIDTIF